MGFKIIQSDHYFVMKSRYLDRTRFNLFDCTSLCSFFLFDFKMGIINNMKLFILDEDRPERDITFITFILVSYGLVLLFHLLYTLQLLS